jgi:hypothetical protein
MLKSPYSSGHYGQYSAIVIQQPLRHPVKYFHSFVHHSKIFRGVTGGQAQILSEVGLSAPASRQGRVGVERAQAEAGHFPHVDKVMFDCLSLPSIASGALDL